MKYVELRAHTAFSFGDGSVAPEKLVNCAVDLGYDAIGITDTADMGAMARAKVEAAAKIKLILGNELRVDGRPLALLARNGDGCRNIAALVTLSRAGELGSWTPDPRVAREYRRGMPNVPWADVAARAEGTYLLTGPASGLIPRLVREGRRLEAERTLHEWREIFDGKIAVEVQLHQSGGDESALAGALIELAGRARVPWVVVNDPRYLDSDSRLVHDMLTALRAGTTVDDAAARGLLHPNGSWKLKSPKAMRAMWRGREEGIDESVRIAEDCENFSVRWLRPPLPRFPMPDDADADEFLREQTYAGARKRWGPVSDAQAGQLEHELGIIKKLGFAGFFLVMWEAVRFARDRGILCQGRGSAANSAVAYCLQVTAVDPVANGLLFERFLSDIRVPGKSGEYTEAPDIDVDIEHNRREEVLDHMYEEYNRDQAAITCIIQLYRAPNAIQDSMRALGYPHNVSTLLSKRLHRFDPEDGVGVVEKKLAAQFGVDLDNPRGQAILTAMRTLQDVPRLRSTHVGGFVLSGCELGNYMPIEPTTMGRTIIQFDKDDLDVIGVPKFDFLGLGALTHVRHAFDEIRLYRGKELTLYDLPHDPKTYEMISSGETLGTFQIESRAQISSILSTRPENLYDIAVQIALVRPGPIQGEFVRPYTRRRREQELVTYVHPELEDILKRTQGIPIFQEQAMAISMKLGGFKAYQADGLRRTMGNIRKKYKLEAELEKLRVAMLENENLKTRVTEKVAEQIVKDLLTFANYGFPESHAWSFALIAYATSFLKRNYPTEFYLGLLNAQPMGFYPMSTLIHDARRQGVVVRTPCLKHGSRLCTTEQIGSDPAQRALRIGWRHIKGVKSLTIERVAHAQASGFHSIEDVVRRSGLTRAEAIQFARANAFVVWEPDRRRAAWQALRVAGDTLPFAPARDAEYVPRELDERELIFLDYAATGICITGHPMEHLRDRLRRGGAVSSRDLPNLRDRDRVVVAGLVTVRQRPATAKGTIFILLEDEWGFINVIVSPSLVDKYTEVVKFAPFIVVEGRFEREGAVVNVVGLRFSELESESLKHHIHNFH